MSSITKSNKNGEILRLGVSICLDLVLIETLDLQSRRSRKSRQFQKVSLDNQDWEISILSRHVRKVRKVSIETEKSVKTWHFWQILTVCLDLDRELVNVITFLDRDFSICQDFWAWSLEKVLKKSRLCREISKNLDNLESLDKSRQSQFVSTISINISTKINLNRKISILKISTEKKKSWSQHDGYSWRFSKVSLHMKDDFDLDLDWSRLSRPPRLRNMHSFCNFLLLKYCFSFVRIIPTKKI
jgi:hypothetical protein